MRIPQIQIRQQYAKIKMDIKDASVEIEQSQADLEIKQPRGKLEIKQENVKVEIDNYPLWHDLGFKNIADFAADNAKRGKEEVMKAIGRYVSQGNRFMRIEDKGDPIIDTSVENATPKEGELTIKYIRGPKFNVIPPKLDIKYTPQKPIINSKINPPQYKFNRGEVKVSMAQYNNIEISLKGDQVDISG